MRRRASIDADHLTALSQGRVASRTLADALAVDHATLLHSVISDADDDLRAAVAEAQLLGILKRMQRIGAALGHYLDVEGRVVLATHPSDTVRGWVCFMIAGTTGPHVGGLLEAIRPLADDPHFAVREWAWMAVRPALAADLNTSIRLLSGWAGDGSERIRRFASEALRPRGVWATHIPELKENPDRGLPILEPLRADPSRYVQDSVANWINDAAKTNPDWARALCEQWLHAGTGAATERIATRALRSI